MKIFYENLKISPAVKKIQNYKNKWIQYILQMDRNGLPHLIFEVSTMWETKRSKTASKISELLMVPEQDMRPKTIQAI